MKRDMDKLLSRTLFTYFTILCVIFILKLFGFNYFGLNTENKVIVAINIFISYWRLENVWRTFTLFLNTYIVLSISCNDNSKRMLKFSILTMILSISVEILKNKCNGCSIFMIVELLYLFILSLCYVKFIKKERIRYYNIINYWFFMFICLIFQIISMITRNVTIKNLNDFVIPNLLSLDYLILMIMTHKLYFIKGGNNLCGAVLGYSSDLLISLKKLPIKLQQSYQSRKPKETDNELANKIYLVFFWLYNFFTVAIVLFIATLNDTFIECIFILSSFWINKGVFGKPFHLKKASTCFIVSSLSYYILNRLTFEIGISFLVPVILGISLSYITSLFVARKENIYLYRGMPIDDFYDLITKVTSNQEYINICKMYYIDKETIVKIAIMFNYSEIRIKQIKKKINDDIRELRM